MVDGAFCLLCEKKECSGTGKPCEKVERYLRAEQAKEGYSERHRRRKEVVFDAQQIENLATYRAMAIKYGRKWADRQKRKSKDFMA